MACDFEYCQFLENDLSYLQSEIDFTQSEIDFETSYKAFLESQKAADQTEYDNCDCDTILAGRPAPAKDKPTVSCCQKRRLLMIFIERKINRLQERLTAIKMMN